MQEQILLHPVLYLLYRGPGVCAGVVILPRVQRV